MESPSPADYNPPASLEALREFENSYAIRLPQRFIELHTTIDGRRRQQSAAAEGWLSIDDMRAMIERWQDLLVHYFGEQWTQEAQGFCCHQPEQIQAVLYHNQWIPFLRINNVLWCMDFAPAAGGKAGQVIRVDTAKSLPHYHIRLQADDFDQWFDSQHLQQDNPYTSYITEQVKHYKAKYYVEPFLSDNSTPYRLAIREHVEKHIGPVKAVFHEQRDSEHPVDILWVAAEEDIRPYHTLITCGMSSYRMPPPPGQTAASFFRYAELLVLLPEDWPVGLGVFSDSRNYWPAHWLQTIAHLPRKLQEWFGEGQDIANGENASLIEDTPFGGVLLLPPLLTLPDAFATLETEDGNKIRFCALIPLTPQEIHYKKRYGLDALLQKFDVHRSIGDIVQPDRQSIID